MFLLLPEDQTFIFYSYILVNVCPIFASNYGLQTRFICIFQTVPSSILAITTIFGQSKSYFKTYTGVVNMQSV